MRCNLLESEGAARPWRGWAVRLFGLVSWLTLVVTNSGVGRAELQFDVFLGYGGQPTGMDGVVREAGWFALGCEIHNDGPGFDAVFEVASADSSQGQSQRLAVELPSNTRKRFVIPVFAPNRGGVWTARLIDIRGKVRAEHTGLRPRALAWESFLMGAVPRTYAGAPRLPNVPGGGAATELQPVVARMPVELVPDGAIAFEGLDAFYLSSERALELKAPQAEALTSWVQGGGHLLVAVEQVGDVNATPWLRVLMPCALGEAVTLKPTRQLNDWLRTGAEGTGTMPDAMAGARRVIPNVARPTKYRRERPGAIGRLADGTDPFGAIQPDLEFEKGEFLVATARLRGARVDLSMDGKPLVVSGTAGRGRVTVLLFSPEREPFRSWKNQEWFWARLLGTPPEWYSQRNVNLWGGYSIDAAYGSMIDSRQVRKLPVRWLLLLLLAYLVVIGPFDQWILKRLNRQMLTWITFPGYVVLFSLLIYYIGYRLRAGDTEWNEIHLVDVVTRPDATQWRGRTYVSLYSPVNARYRFASEIERSTLRGEFLGVYGGSSGTGRLEVEHRERGFEAEVFVPVWTSRLVVCDWLKTGEPPMEASLSIEGANFRVRVQNRLPVSVPELQLVVRGRVVRLGSVDAGAVQEFTITPGQGETLATFVAARAQQFAHKAQMRQRAFGEDQWIDLNSENLATLSFVGQMADQMPHQRDCIYPDGTELSTLVDRGDAILLAWVPNHAPVASLRRFEAKRQAQGTLLRLTMSPAAETAR